jgi:FMN phosphatase YigB (HAD superfamily)
MKPRELITINSLASVPQMPIWGTVEVLFLDVDYTVLDFDKGHKAGIQAISEMLGEPIGNEVSRIFYKVLKTKSGLLTADAEYQQILDDSDGRIWSRERLIQIALNNLKLELSPNMVIDGSDTYWHHLGLNSGLYSDATLLLDNAKAGRKNIVWVTDSDHHLEYDSKLLKYTYDPIISRVKKEYRLKTLINRYPGDLFIGDPVGKPKMWSEVFSRVSFNVETSVAIGDGNNDVVPLVERGGRGFLINR